MHAIDFSHKIIPRKVSFAKIPKKIFFGDAAAKFTNLKYNFRLYYPDLNLTFTNNTLCAGSDYTGAGTVDDWGTPLMVANDNGTWFQTGIYSAYFYIDNQHDLLAQRKL
jgi:hypothetical protein